MPSSSNPSSGSQSNSTGGPTTPPVANWTPLHEAVLQLDLSATQQLLQQGADPNAACVGGITPAMLLCLMHCYEELVGPAQTTSLPHGLHEHLMDWRDSVYGGDSIYDSTKSLLELLLAHGARVDLLYPGGYDMLEAASIAGAPDLLEVLLGVEPFRSMKEGTWSSGSSSSSQPGAAEPADASTCNTVPALTTTSSSGSTHSDAVEAGSDGVRTPSSVGNVLAATCSTVLLDRRSQPLTRALQEGYAECPEVLQLGWRPEVHSVDAGTALLTTCKKGLFAVALALVNAGADVNYHHNQETPLGNLVHWLNGMVGRMQQHPQQLELARLLVAKGARTADGATPVQVAVAAGWVPLLQACVEAGAGAGISGSVLVQQLEGTAVITAYNNLRDSSRDSNSMPASLVGAPANVAEMTMLELAMFDQHFTTAAMLIALGGRFAPGRTLEQLQQLERGGRPRDISETVQALLLAGLLRHGAQQAGQQTAVEAYDMLISVLQERHGVGTKPEPISSRPQDNAGGTQCSAPVAATSTSSSATAECTTAAAAGAGALAAAGAGAEAREAAAEGTKGSAMEPTALSSTAGSSSNGVQGASTASKSAAAAAERMQAETELCMCVYSAVCRLVQRPADLGQLLAMLVALGSQGAAEQQLHKEWGWKGGKASWEPFSSAMRHLQQQYTLQPGALAAVHYGLWQLASDAMVPRTLELHTLHHWALGRIAQPLPLPLLQLLGVSADLPCSLDGDDDMGLTHNKLHAALGSQATPLALALSPREKSTKEQQQHQLWVVKALVAAGASYKWEGPAGATVLSLAAELVQTDCLAALLARPNALQEFTPDQVSAALVAAAHKSHYVSGCLVLEAVAAARSQPPAAEQPAVAVRKRKSREAPAPGSKTPEAHPPAARPAATPAFQNALAEGSVSGVMPAAASTSGVNSAAVLEPDNVSSAGRALADTSATVAGCGAPATAAEGAPGAAQVPSAAPAQSAAAAASLVLTPAAAAASSKLLVVAVKRCKADYVRRLLAAGVDPNVRPDGKSDMAIHEVVNQADVKGSNLDVTKQMLEELLSAGADINATTTGLGTPVMMALWQQKLPVAKLLLEHKPDLQPVDKLYRPAIDYAAQNFGLEGVKLLLQAGGPLPEGGVQRLVTTLKCHASLAKVSVGAVTARLRMVVKQCQPAGSSSSSGSSGGMPEAAGVGCDTSTSGSSQLSKPGHPQTPEDKDQAGKAAAAAAALLAEEEAAAAAAAAKAAKKAAKKQRQADAKAAAALAAEAGTGTTKQQQEGVSARAAEAGKTSDTAQLADEKAGARTAAVPDSQVKREQEGQSQGRAQQQEEQLLEMQRPAEVSPAPAFAADTNAGITDGHTSTRSGSSSTYLQVVGPSSPTAAAAVANTSSPPWKTAASKRHTADAQGSADGSTASSSSSSASSKHAKHAAAQKASGGRTTPEGKRQQQQQQTSKSGTDQRQQKERSGLDTLPPGEERPALAADAAGKQGKPVHNRSIGATSSAVPHVMAGQMPQTVQPESARSSQATQQVAAAAAGAVANDGQQPAPSTVATAATPAAAHAAGPAAAGGVEYVNPLPWLPTLWVPVQRTHPAAMPAAVAVALGTGMTGVASSGAGLNAPSSEGPGHDASTGTGSNIRAAAAAPPVGSAPRSSGSGTVTNLPWLAVGQAVSLQVGQQHTGVPSRPWPVHEPRVLAPSGSDTAAGTVPARLADSTGAQPPAVVADMYTTGSTCGPSPGQLRVRERTTSISASSSGAADSATPAKDAQDAWASLLLAPGATSGAATRPSSRQSLGMAALQPATSRSVAVPAAAAGSGTVPPAAAAAAAASFWSRSTLIPRKQVTGETECVVCWEAPPSVQLLPCKHTVLCRRCSDALRKQEGQECPMCRTLVQKRVHMRL